MNISPETLAAHNITRDEYARILDLLGREPSFVELGIFSVMWSEHCSYKSSRVHLKRLPTTGARVRVPPGENAGVVDVGDGWCAAFKVESHNHPSFIEPFQGAATGVGGILRDIFTMGARPIAAMNSLRFGTLDHPEHGRRNRRIMAGCVAGIAGYGNSFGVATVGGEVAFDDAYNFNPLVNAFALGLVREDQIFFGKATGLGNPVLYVGAKTGRDGIHGATMASAEFDEAAMEKRPTVQVGDPFLEKLLLEACLEAMRTGAIAGIQDMGAAGLTSSSCEMAARAGTGLELDLDLVPQRETNMTAYEMMLSESQERMLLVAHEGREREVIDVFRKWDLDAVVVGRVTNTHRLEVLHNGERVADLPVAFLTDEAPRYERLMRRRTKGARNEATSDAKSVVSNSSVASNSSVVSNFSPTTAQLVSTKDCNEALRRVLSSPNLASKRWVFRQYDHMVRTNTVVLPGADAAVVRIKETRRSLAMCLDGNSRYCAVNPREGAKYAVAEGARNVACVGARPIAVTNCLNFASPERPEVMWAFSETIDGMAEACLALNTPVISGNVSFYNETVEEGEVRSIPPTPVIGMVGLLDDVRTHIQPGFKAEGEIVALLGELAPAGTDLSVSEYAATIEGRTLEEMIADGKLTMLDLTRERAVQEACARLAEAGVLSAAHDTSDGGFAVALAELCFTAPGDLEIGATINLDDALSARAPLSARTTLESAAELAPATTITAAATFDSTVESAVLLFNEAPSRIIISFHEEHIAHVRSITAAVGCPFAIIGRTGGGELTIQRGGEIIVRSPIAELARLWRTSLESKLAHERAA